MRYADGSGVEIAYQVLGEGPADVVWVAGAFTHLGVMWEHAGYRRACQQLAAFSRLILFDKRGMGLSERARVGTLEERMEDVRAVHGCGRVRAGGADRRLRGRADVDPVRRDVPGANAGAPLDRRRGQGGEDRRLAVGRDYARGIRGLDAAGARALGQGARGVRLLLADEPDQEAAKAWLGKLQSASATPRDAVAFMRVGLDIDVRDVVSSIHVPTLIVHRVDDPICHVENARFLAANIEGAKYVELPGANHVPWVGQPRRRVLGEIREFLTGVREAQEPDRVLATVLFTDIVGSTERATELGDRRWRELLDAPPCSRAPPARALPRPRDRHGRRRLPRDASTGRRGRSAARARRSTPCGSSGSTSAPACTPGSARCIGGKLAGIAVHIGARVAGQAGPGEVLVSSTVRDLVAGSGSSSRTAGRLR